MKHAYLFFLLLCIQPVSAQDYHFSDPTRALTLFNPAYTGLIPEGGKYRLQTIVRDQWGSVLEEARYRTFATSFDTKFCGQNAGDYFALGANVTADWQGDPALRRTDVYLTGAFVKNIGGSPTAPNLLGGGVEVGRVQYAQDGLRGRTFDDQFDNPGLPGEFLSQSMADAFDVGLGGFFTADGNESGLHDISVGASLKHLTRPALGFFGNTQDGMVSSDSTARLNRRLNANVGFSFFNNRQRSVSVFAAYSNQQPHSQLLVRVMYNVLGSRELLGRRGRQRARTLAGGVAIRVNDGAGGPGGDALIGIVQLHQQRFILGLSYDLNISNLRQSSSGQGAIELAGSFFFGGAGCVICPSF